VRGGSSFQNASCTSSNAPDARIAAAWAYTGALESALRWEPWPTRMSARVTPPSLFATTGKQTSCGDSRGAWSLTAPTGDAPGAHGAARAAPAHPFEAWIPLTRQPGTG